MTLPIKENVRDLKKVSADSNLRTTSLRPKLRRGLRELKLLSPRPRPKPRARPKRKVKHEENGQVLSLLAMSRANWTTNMRTPVLTAVVRRTKVKRLREKSDQRFFSDLHEQGSERISTFPGTKHTGGGSVFCG